MKRIKVVVLFLLVILLISASACSQEPSPYAFDYPKEITSTYCFENYSAFDPNIRYTECYEFVTANNRTERISSLTSVEYSAIKGVDDLSFMVYYKTIIWFGENRWIGVVRRNDCNIEPIMDYTPSKIELCTYEDILELNPYLIDVEEDPEKYYNYAAHTFSEPILTVNSPEAIAEIMAVAQRPTTMTKEENYQEQREFPSKYDLNAVLWHDEPVYVKISFNECAGVVWVGQLLTDDEGKVYMERSTYVHGEDPGNKEAELHVGSTFPTPSGTSFCYPLGEYMTTILSGLEEMEE